MKIPTNLYSLPEANETEINGFLIRSASYNINWSLEKKNFTCQAL